MSSTNSKILLVDDDPAILRILTKWLEKEGYEVRQAEDGRQALAAIEEECPDFLITDWEMPGMDGLQLCRAVRESNHTHYIYILFLTVKASPAELIEGLEMGADDFLSKPIYQGELLARLRSGARVLELERRLSLLARTDPLTGLSTQRSFYEILEKEWQRSKRFHLPLSCVMMDLDFFKRINDIHGHPAGDAILKQVAGVLVDNCRGSDTVSRYGGEEFCVMLPETNEMEAALWADRVRQRVAAMPIPVGRKEIRVTASLGVSQKNDDTHTGEQLVDQADQALLCAKQSGRDRVVRYESLSDGNDLDLEKADKYDSLFSGITARRVMSPLVACLREDETVGQASEFFLRSRINSTPVVNKDGRLVGILSEKDLMAAMVSLDWWRTPVLEVMKPNVICYEEDTPIQAIYEFLCRVSIRRIVIAKDNRPTGTISQSTLLRWFRNEVFNQGLLDPDGVPEALAGDDPHRSRERLTETAQSLAELATDLHRRLGQNGGDLMPYVVGGATRIEELVNDLLAYSRYANDGTATGAAALQSMLLTSSHMD